MIRLNWLIALLAAFAPAGTDQDQVRMVELGTLGGHHSRAHAINDRGEIVGVSSTWDSTRAFLWRDGHMTDLGTLGGRHSVAMDINNRSEIVGWSQTADGSSHAFLWRDGQMTDLGTLDGAGGYSTANAINDYGVIVGDNGGPNGLQAFLWHGDRMSALGADPTRAAAINNLGDVVGTNFADATFTATLWHSGQSTRLGEGNGMAINDRGQVVIGDAWLWGRGLLTRIDPPSGATTLGALGINNRGTVVGFTDLGAFVWNGGRARTLPRAAGDTVASAMDVNDRGQIVGSSGVQEGFMRAVLWT